MRANTASVKVVGPAPTDRPRSHNVGENCMSCHHPDGEGHGCWQIGGTVYYSDHHTTLSNAKLLLFTLPRGQGTFVRSIDVDGLGNVYTSDKIPFDQTIFLQISSHRAIPRS